MFRRCELYLCMKHYDATIILCVAFSPFHHTTPSYTKMKYECVYLYISCGNFNTMIQGVHIYAILNEMENIKKEKKRKKKHTTYNIYKLRFSGCVIFCLCIQQKTVDIFTSSL